MEYKITVIIPCYNAEKTLKRCINSVLNQTIGFENIELILYDDASKDNTSSIIKQYSEEYENIIGIYSKNNSGYPGKGRNTGIKNANSPFIMFMDNDDEYDINMCKTLYEEIITEKSTIVITGFSNIYETRTDKVYTKYLGGKQVDDKIIFTSNDVFHLNNWSIWCCIFKKDILINNDIYFPENKMGEDAYFMLNYYNYVDKIIYLKEYFGLNRYVQKDSLSSNFTIQHLNDFLFLSQSSLNNITKKCNLSFVFHYHIHFLILQICISDIGFPKNELKSFLKKLNSFEKDMEVNQYIDSFIIKSINSLIMKKQFNLSIFIIKLVKPLYHSKNITKIYRMLITQNK